MGSNTDRPTWKTLLAFAIPHFVWGSTLSFSSSTVTASIANNLRNSPSVLSLMWSSHAFKGLIGPLLFQVRPPPNHGDNKPHSYERNNAVLKPAAH
jgi:predicted MFS family arabinose efflux permease